MAELITRDFRDVEIMAVGTWDGRGCPDGGCAFTEDVLQEIADATNAAMANNHTAPVKLGHDRQSLLEQEELPAGGWLENIRRKGDKLFADVLKVPNRIAQIMEAGGWRNRSVELQKIDGKLVLTGLALLGTKLPAINTLNDIEALYASLDLGEPAETVLVFVDTKDADHTTEWLITIAELHPEAKTQIAALSRAIDGGIDMDLKVLAEKVGLKADASEEDVMAKLTELQTEEEPKEEPKETPAATTKTPEEIAASKKDNEEITSLSARVLEFETREAARDASDLVETAIVDGKLLPAQRETSMAFALRDPKGFKGFVKAQPKIMDFGERGTSNDGSTDAGDFEPTEMELSIAKETGQTKDMIVHQKMLDAGVTPSVELSEKVFGKKEA